MHNQFIPIFQESTVEKCLIEFFQEETIDDLSCSKCGIRFIQKSNIQSSFSFSTDWYMYILTVFISFVGSRPISKQLQICKYPNVLVLQLNRSTTVSSMLLKCIVSTVQL